MRLRKDGIDSMARVKAARDIFAALPGIWTRSRTGGTRGAEDGLHGGATLPADRCHLNDAAVRINCHHRYDTAVGKNTWSSEQSASIRISPRSQRMSSSSSLSSVRSEDGRT